MDQDIIIAKGRLGAFIIEMNQWEIFCDQISKQDKLSFEEQYQLKKEKLVEIFSRFCTAKDRKHQRPNTIFYGLDGFYGYDPNDEVISNTTKERSNRITIETKRDKHRIGRRKYVLLKKDNNWLIDSKKWETSESKWKIVSL